MSWQQKALETLNRSLLLVKTELNELDWKSGLSENTERLSEHISAFANIRGGGFLVFGIDNEGRCRSTSKNDGDKIS